MDPEDVQVGDTGFFSEDCYQEDLIGQPFTVIEIDEDDMPLNDDWSDRDYVHFLVRYEDSREGWFCWNDLSFESPKEKTPKVSKFKQFQQKVGGNL